MVETQYITFPAFEGASPRRSYVYVPDFAADDPGARFPVLYMFDGQNVFFDSDATYGKSWGMLTYLEYTGLPLIVAAVECNDGRNNERLSEYSPYSFKSPVFGDVTGRGTHTMEWLINEYKPLIDREFPTLSDRKHTMIAGSSMGGLMSIYALMAYNNVFSKAAALSPSVAFCPERVRELIDCSVPDPDTVLYMDCGEKELGRYGRASFAMDCYADVTAQLLKKRVRLTSRIVPDGEHNETSWEKQVPFFLDALFYTLEDESGQ